METIEYFMYFLYNSLMTLKKRLSALTLATVFVQGFVTPAIALGTCSIETLDTVAGLGTQVTVTSCVPDEQTTLRMEGPNDMVYTQSIVLDESGNATTLIPSTYTLTAGTYAVSLEGNTQTFQVLADRADDAQSTLVASPNSVRSGGKDVVTVTTVLRDRYDNPVSGRPIALMSSRGTDSIQSITGQTDSEGRMVWKVTPSQSGLMTLIPYDIISSKQLMLRADVAVGSTSRLQSALTGFERGGNTALAADFPATADLSSTVVDRFVLELPQGVTDVQSNELFGMTIRAVRGNETVRGYVGTLVVESSDPDAELPKKGEDPNSPLAGRIDMRSVDQGLRSLSLIFLLRRNGPQTITVYDKNDPSIRGEITLNVLRGDGTAGGNIVIIDPPNRSRIKGHTVMLQGRAPSLVNLTVKGGLRPVDAESDEEGVFRVSVELHPDNQEATLFVESENGTYESEPHYIFIDTTAPAIKTIFIDPEEGSTDSPSVITVTSEPDLASVTATVQEKEVPLTETGSGLYVGSVTAPKEVGTYDVTVKATDSVGNETTMLTKWTVAPSEVPRVIGVTAESQPLKVALRWEKVDTVPVKEYVIYIADQSDPTNYLYSIPTKEPVLSAVIADLPLGRTYHFSLTAVTTDGKESSEKSEFAVASPIGTRLNVTSGEASLLLEWNKQQDLTLDHYVLEYGTEPGAYSEKRTVNGEAVSTMLRDLIDGIEYYLRLTPTDITGNIRHDMAVLASGTPGGTGFRPGAEDPAPPDVLNGLHPGAGEPPVRFDNVPFTPGSGISSILTALAVILSVSGGMLLMRHRTQRKRAHEFLQQMQQRYQS